VSGPLPSRGRGSLHLNLLCESSNSCQHNSHTDPLYPCPHLHNYHTHPSIRANLRRFYPAHTEAPSHPYPETYFAPNAAPTHPYPQPFSAPPQQQAPLYNEQPYINEAPGPGYPPFVTEGAPNRPYTSSPAPTAGYYHPATEGQPSHAYPQQQHSAPVFYGLAHTTPSYMQEHSITQYASYPPVQGFGPAAPSSQPQPVEAGPLLAASHTDLLIPTWPTRCRPRSLRRVHFAVRIQLTGRLRLPGVAPRRQRLDALFGDGCPCQLPAPLSRRKQLPELPCLSVRTRVRDYGPDATARAPGLVALLQFPYALSGNFSVKDEWSGSCTCDCCYGGHPYGH
jgi:hypothetical protein